MIEEINMTENNNLVTSTQEIMKEALHKLGFDDGMYELVKRAFKIFRNTNSCTYG